MTSSSPTKQRLIIPKCFSGIRLKQHIAALASNPRSDVCHLSRLSEELLREIVNHIRQDSRDQDTLRSSAFVCKRFRKVFLPEAYQKVAFNGFKSLKSFIRILRQCDTFPKGYIRSLNLSFTPASISDELRDPSSGFSFSMMSFKTEDLKSRVAQEFLSTLWIIPVLQSLQGITTLVIEGLSVNHHVVDTFALLPCLASLSYHIYEDHEATFISDGRLLPPTLSLSMLRTSPTFLRRLMVITVGKRRKSCCGSCLDDTSRWESQTSILSRLLIASFHSLEHIFIRGDYFRLGPQEFYMHYFPSLTKLTLQNFEDDSKNLNHFLATHSMNTIDVSICAPSREVAYDDLKTSHRSVIKNIPGFLDLEKPDKLEDDHIEMGWTVSDFAIRLEHQHGDQVVTELAVVNASSPCIISSMCQRQLHIRVLNLWWTLLDLELDVRIFDKIPPLVSLEVLRLGCDLELLRYHDEDSDGDSSDNSAPDDSCCFECPDCDAENGPRDGGFYQRLGLSPPSVGIDLTLREKYPSLVLVELFSLGSRNGCIFFWSFRFSQSKLGSVVYARLIHPHALGGEKVKWEMERGMSVRKSHD